MEKFVPCRKCVSKGIRGQSNGFIFNKDDNTLIECSCHIKYRNLLDLESRMKRSGFDSSEFALNYNLDKDYVGTKSLTSITKIKKYLAEFKNYNPNYHHVLLYIDGKNGTQKTTVANYIGKEILSTIKQDNSNNLYPSHYRAEFIQMNELIKWLQKKDSFTENENDLSNRIEQADVLIIDESFDKEKVTIYKSGYQIPFLDSFLRKWMTDSSKSIIFISNVKPSEIEENGYSHSIQDFVERQVKIFNSEFELIDNYIDNVDTITGSLF